MKAILNSGYILHGCVEIRNFSFSVEKYFTSERSKRVKYFAAKGVYFYTNANEILNHFVLVFLLRKGRFIVQP